MALRIYEDLTGRHHWAESSSASTIRKLARGEWVLYDDTPDTPPPPGDPLDNAVSALVTPGSGSKTELELRAAFGPRADVAQAAAGSGLPLRYALDAGLTCAFGVQSDSTAAYPNSQSMVDFNWPYLLGERIADRYPDLRVVYYPWEAVGEKFSAPVVIQEGAAGERYVQFQAGGRTMAWPASDNSGADAVIDVHLTGDLDVAIRITPDSPTINTTNDHSLVGRTTFQRLQFAFKIKGTGAGADAGKLALLISPDGLGFSPDRRSSVAPTFTAGQPLWLRFTYVPATGVTTFYTSTDGATWDQLGTPHAGSAQQQFDQTSIFQLSGYGWSSISDRFIGKVHEVRIRNGIDGPMVAPAIPDRWSRYPLGDGETTVPFGGSQTLYIVNGSRAGQNTTFLSDAARLPKMTPDYGQLLHFYASSHNDGPLAGEALLARWETWRQRLRARLPLAAEMLVTQNPAQAPANWLREQIVRPHQLAAWAQRNGIGVADTERAFLSDPRGLAALLQADGRHPNELGQELMTDVIEAAVLGHP